MQGLAEFKLGKCIVLMPGLAQVQLENVLTYAYTASPFQLNLSIIEVSRWDSYQWLQQQSTDVPAPAGI
jgi:hypothetical protein